MIPGRTPSHPSFRRSFLFALQGFRTAVRQERNIKVMLGGAAFAVAMGIVLRIGPTDWAVVAVCCGMVLAAELVNTAIETVVDLVSPEFHPLAGRAKDIAAASSWLLSIAAAVAGLCVYGHALLDLLAR